MNKKYLSILVLVLTLAFTTKALASLTFSDSAISGTAPSSIDVGAGNTLSLQNTNNGAITTGTGLTTLGGGLNVTGDVGIGTTAPTQKLDVVGSINIPTGSAYMYNGLNLISAITVKKSYFFGNNAGNLTMTGLGNTAVGGYSLNGNETGAFNTALGMTSLEFNTTGSYNVSLGHNTLQYNDAGSNNTAVGDSSLYNNDGNNNTGVGYGSLYTSTSGSGNVALGYYAGRYETGSNSFYVDNQNRTNTAGDKAGALLYGTFDATPANQTLKINAKITASSATNKGTITLTGGTATVAVNTGAVCVVSETTDATKTVKGAVSGTTLTITGNGTDTIAYICL